MIPWEVLFDLCFCAWLLLSLNLRHPRTSLGDCENRSRSRPLRRKWPGALPCPPPGALPLRGPHPVLLFMYMCTCRTVGNGTQKKDYLQVDTLKLLVVLLQLSLVLVESGKVILNPILQLERLELAAHGRDERLLGVGQLGGHGGGHTQLMVK